MSSKTERTFTDAQYLMALIDTTLEGVPAVKRHHERMRAIAAKVASSDAHAADVAVPIPTTEEQATGMALLGTNWLLKHAPHRLKSAQAAEAGEALPVLVYDAGNERRIEAAKQRDGSVKWAVRRDGSCLARDGMWEYEPMPSSRDDEFMARCRFSSVDEARAALKGDSKEGK